MEDAPASVREATRADHVAVARVTDGALLDVEDREERLADGTVLVATIEERIVGAVVVAPEGPSDPAPPPALPAASHVRAIAVRRTRRRCGIGSALLGAAVDRWAPLLADFDPDVAPFYEALEGPRVDVETVEGTAADAERCWALLRAP